MAKEKAKSKTNKKEKEAIKKTGELFNIEETSLGKSAKRYLAIKDKIEDMKDELGKEGEGLLKEMKEAKKLTITIEGTCLSIKYVESKESIKVSKTPEM